MKHINEVTEDQLSEYDKIKAQGKKAPLEFLLSVMHNENVPLGLRMDAAKASMPYVHKKLPQTEDDQGTVRIIQPYIPSRAELAEIHADEIND